MTSLAHLQRFYQLLDDLAHRTGGPRRLSECTGRLEWPQRGVYFFLEPGELRTETGSGPRVVRVGTHGLKSGSKTSLWNRLSQHRGSQSSGRGNHRGSIFRLLVGAALVERHGLDLPTWGAGSSAPRDVRALERDLEREVSSTLGAMEILWVAVPDDAGPATLRGMIERNSIALLSQCGGQHLDRPSDGWLGHHCPRELVRASGLWNQNHVGGSYDPGFLDVLESHISSMSVTE